MKPLPKEITKHNRIMRQTWRDKDFEIKLAAQYETIGVIER